MTSLGASNALAQAKISIILTAIIPCLSLFYLGRVTGSENSTYSFVTLLTILLLTGAVAIPGFLILRKYPKNIMKLREYITEISKGTLPDKIELTDAQDSDDINYIEEHFNRILDAMRHRISAAEESLRVEQTLRKTIEQQQQSLLEADRHRTMIQTLGAACHHIGQPATVLQIRMEFLQTLVTGDEEMQEIKACVQAVQSISDILHKLQQVSNFRTVPYIQETSDAPDERILDID